MIRLLIWGLGLWLVVFLVRIWMIGGLDPNYYEAKTETLTATRLGLADKLEILLPHPQSALLSGILLGEQSRLPYQLKLDLQGTSTIHMAVVSGQNLTILAGVFVSLASWIGRRWAIGLTILAIVGYSLLTGLQVPVIRAGIMAGAALIAQLVGREVLGWWVLVITAALMLLINPNWLFSISFQLSFLATTGVLVVAPIILKHLEKIPVLIRQDLGVTIAAQALVLPIIAANFNQISLVGVVANILTLWTIPIVMVSGSVALAVGIVSQYLGSLVAIIPSTLLTFFIYTVRFFAHLPLSSLEIGAISPLVWLGYYLVIVGGVWGLVIKSKV